MKRVLPNIRLLSRWILIFGVMAGLFLSSSEGIQLLPFPHQETVKENEAKFELETAKPYSYSVHNTKFSSFSKQTKSQKNFRDFDYLISNTYDNFAAVKFRSGIILQNFPQPAFFNTSTEAGIPSDRAPPLV